MANLPEQETGDIKVSVRKDSKSNFNLIIKDGGIVVNQSTGKELDPKKDAKLINKALLKSGLLKYEKITEGKQVYAVTAIGTIVNITPDSTSNGNEISNTSPVGKKVMAKYTGKFTGKVDEIGSEDLAIASGEDLVREMLNGKSITDFTVEEQRAIDSVSLDRKKSIKAELDNKAYEAEIEASKNPEEEMDNAIAILVKERDAAIKKAGIMKLDFTALDGPGNTAEHKKNGEIINAAEDAKQLVYDQYQAKIDDLIDSFNEKKESPKISDPKMLLMGMNDVDLSNERAITQEQEDLSEITKVNESTSLFEASLEFDGEIDFSQVSNDESPASNYSQDDTTSSIFNTFEDEFGCGF
jgi:hypothetical protein